MKASEIIAEMLVETSDSGLKRCNPKDSQKGIIIGHKGESIKRVGVEARKDLEKFFEKQIHLELFVKVKKDWKNDERMLRNFGY
jgi:GTP-binding protein Era